MPLYDLHSHWGTEELYPLRTPEARARQFDVWKTEAKFWTKDEMAAYFRKNDVKVMLDLGFSRHEPMDRVRALHDEIFAFERQHPDVTMGMWLQLGPHTAREGIDEIERCRKMGRGLVGLVVSAMGNKLPLTDPSFAPFYDYCVQVGMPAMFMVGYTGVGANTPGGDGIVLELNHPRYVDAIAAAYPKLTIIAGRPAWPWQSEMIATLLHKANVYAELHGVSPKRLTDEFKREIRGRLKHKIMFGMDFPMLRYEKITADWISEGYPQDVLDGIFHGNAERLLAQLKAGAAT